MTCGWSGGRGCRPPPCERRRGSLRLFVPSLTSDTCGDGSAAGLVKVVWLVKSLCLRPRGSARLVLVTVRRTLAPDRGFLQQACGVWDTPMGDVWSPRGWLLWIVRDLPVLKACGT
ncbi:hypothetical protein NDU88_008797 [Pleurodeles waltl]|uniref:Uncharacterized protein n=1 Tax=Pleurodeles waltl TaxID=8319 RepID=A0AAV7RU56_PLEWA|nr:hypothetical protein NDU88_008797 [Pleurodeles waltl]